MPRVSKAARVVQAGAVAVDRTGPVPLFLLVTRRRDPSRWIFPKGRIESGESAEAAALRELEEEAGVVGKILTSLGTSKAVRFGEPIQVAYFLVDALNEGESEEEREKQWLEFKPARARLSYSQARALLDSARSALGRSVSPSA